MAAVSGLAIDLGRPDLVRAARDLAKAQAKGDLLTIFDLGVVQADLIAQKT